MAKTGRVVLGHKGFVAYGRRIKLNPEAHHERLEDFPPRYLVDFRDQTLLVDGISHQILDICANCRATHRVWLTADRYWNLITKNLRKKRLCVECFRAAFEGRNHGL